MGQTPSPGLWTTRRCGFYPGVAQVESALHGWRRRCCCRWQTRIGLVLWSQRGVVWRHGVAKQPSRSLVGAGAPRVLVSQIGGTSSLVLRLNSAVSIRAPRSPSNFQASAVLSSGPGALEFLISRRSSAASALAIGCTGPLGDRALLIWCSGGTL